MILRGEGVKKAIALFLIIVLSIPLFGGCKGDFNLSCRIGERPSTLDPQMASTLSELVIVGNAFEGLLKLDKNGSPVLAAAEKYQVSDDGKQYTFTLKKGLKWSNGEALTARDFVFGLKRALDGNTGAPFSHLLNSISGSKEALAGDTSSLGIYATSENEIKITLNKKDDNFLYSLCHPIASPCNKEYFEECKGKYGITAKTIISNGIYKVSYMVENLIRISKNTNYKGNFKTYCSSVEFDFEELKEIEYHDKIQNNNWDIVYINDKTDISRIDTKNFHTADKYTSAYYLIFNAKSIGCQGKNIRASLALSVNKEDLGVTPINGWLPSDILICGKLPNSLNGLNSSTYAYDVANAKKLFLESSSETIINSLQNTPIYCSSDKNILSSAVTIASNWQQQLGIYMNVESMDSAHLTAQISSGNFNVAITKVSSVDGTVGSFFDELSTLLGSPSRLEKEKNNLLLSKSLDENISLINSCIIEISDNYYALPISVTATSFLYTDKYSGISLNNVGVMDFSLIDKK